MLKAEASVLIRLEIAKGKSDNEALYLRFGHSFRVHYRGQGISVHGGTKEHENLFLLSMQRLCHAMSFCTSSHFCISERVSADEHPRGHPSGAHRRD
jgi:hypothetical protein